MKKNILNALFILGTLLPSTTFAYYSPEQFRLDIMDQIRYQNQVDLLQRQKAQDKIDNEALSNLIKSTYETNNLNRKIEEVKLKVQENDKKAKIEQDILQQAIDINNKAIEESKIKQSCTTIKGSYFESGKCVCMGELTAEYESKSKSYYCGVSREAVEQEIVKLKITQKLGLGSKGIQVNLLQSRLGIEPTGYFGKQTQKAVKEFQKKNKLLQTGTLGPATLEKLNM